MMLILKKSPEHTLERGENDRDGDNDEWIDSDLHFVFTHLNLGSKAWQVLPEISHVKKGVLTCQPSELAPLFTGSSSPTSTRLLDSSPFHLLHP